MKHLHMLVGNPTHASAIPATLGKLIARSHPLAGPASHGMSATLARLFGLAARDLPALLLAAEGIEAGSQAWFRADPVHLMAGMHSITLFDSRHFPLHEEETSALIATLNAHFAGQAEFLAPHPTRWYARFQKPLTVEAPPLDQVAGGSVGLDFIDGPDTRELQRTAMEIQMLLHDHPVNVEREAANRASINGVWLWGGCPMRKPAAAFQRIYADDFTTQALALAAGVRQEKVPDPLDPAAIESDTLVVLEEADEAWFELALSSLQRGRIDRLTLTRPGHPDCRLDRWQSLRFWRNQVPVR